jgi:hypothetical protein
MADITKTIAVRDMPAGVRNACIERGFFETDEMTVKEAMKEWTAWELGDGSWGYMAAEYVNYMTTRNSIL